MTPNDKAIEVFNTLLIAGRDFIGSDACHASYAGPVSDPQDVGRWECSLPLNHTGDHEAHVEHLLSQPVKFQWPSGS